MNLLVGMVILACVSLEGIKSGDAINNHARRTRESVSSIQCDALRGIISHFY